jgi:hypothetical protein
MSSITIAAANQGLIDILQEIDIIIKQALPLQLHSEDRFAEDTRMQLGARIAQILVSKSIPDGIQSETCRW